MANHEARIVLYSEGVLHVELRCPYDGVDLTGIDYDRFPPCRQDREEDGSPIPDSPALGYCNPLEWIINDDRGEMKCFATDQPVIPSSGWWPITFKWDGDCYEWTPLGAEKEMTP